MGGLHARSQDWPLNNTRNDYSVPGTMGIGNGLNGHLLFSHTNPSSHCTKIMIGHLSDIAQVKNFVNPVRYWQLGLVAMVWQSGGAMSFRGTANLCIIHKNLNQWDYIGSLGNQMIPFAHLLGYSNNQYDNSPCHWGRSVSQWKEENDEIIALA